MVSKRQNLIKQKLKKRKIFKKFVNSNLVTLKMLIQLRRNLRQIIFKNNLSLKNLLKLDLKKFLRFKNNNFIEKMERI